MSERGEGVFIQDREPAREQLRFGPTAAISLSKSELTDLRRAAQGDDSDITAVTGPIDGAEKDTMPLPIETSGELMESAGGADRVLVDKALRLLWIADGVSLNRSKEDRSVYSTSAEATREASTLVSALVENIQADESLTEPSDIEAALHTGMLEINTSYTDKREKAPELMAMAFMFEKNGRQYFCSTGDCCIGTVSLQQERLHHCFPPTNFIGEVYADQVSLAWELLEKVNNRQVISSDFLKANPPNWEKLQWDTLTRETRDYLEGIFGDDIAKQLDKGSGFSHVNWDHFVKYCIESWKPTSFFGIADPHFTIGSVPTIKNSFWVASTDGIPGEAMRDLPFIQNENGSSVTAEQLIEHLLDAAIKSGKTDDTTAAAVLVK